MSRVLIVEDDKILSQGLRQAMEGEGYEVLNAMDGETGLHMARTTQPDLLILDIMMPHLNGFEVITELPYVPGIDKPYPLPELEESADKAKDASPPSAK